MVSVVQQNVFIFDSTIRENITMFKEFPEGQVKQAIRLSGLSKLLEEKGEDYLCGENGCNLSGGERQRISIARVFLKNPPILILDEATSALDTETEKLIQDALASLSSGRTTIAIAHRLSTLRNATRLVVLDEGRVAEMGTHAELVAKGGIYSRVCAMQGMTESCGCHSRKVTSNLMPM